MRRDDEQMPGCLFPSPLRTRGPIRSKTKMDPRMRKDDQRRNSGLRRLRRLRALGLLAERLAALRAQLRLQFRAHRAHVRAALRLLFHDGHRLAHLFDGSRAGLGDRRGDELVELGFR